MPFQYVLANLLAEHQDALGVIFLDDAGETIDLASVEYAPFDLQIIGAYLGIYLRQLGEVTRPAELGSPKFMHFELEKAHLYVTTLPDGYYLAMVQGQPAAVSVARRTMATAADQLRREVFA
jgi:hypothetical protein